MIRTKGGSGDWRSKAGAVYVAYGANARKCLYEAIPAFREYCPGVEVAVIGDRELGFEDHFIEAPDADIGGRIAKLSVYDLTPKRWQYILYMDADTTVQSDPSHLFKVLVDGWEMAICRHWGPHTIARFHQPDNREEYGQSVKELGCEALLSLQAGVFSIRRCQRVAKLMKTWRSEWDRWGKRDQLALIRALHQNPVKLYVLPGHWNRRSRNDDPDTVIRHDHDKARRYSHKAWKALDRFDTPEAWEIVEVG